MIRAGIVGCGTIAEVHAKVISAMEGVTLAGCADIRQERAQALAAPYGAQAHDSLAKMLEADDLDVLHICTPHYLHFPMIGDALDRGLFVFSEKPPVMTAAELAALSALPGKERVAFSFQNRWNGNFREAKRIVESGELGPALGARGIVTWHRTASYYTESGWRGSLATEGGGVVINQAIHTLDLLISLLGRPHGISAMTANHHLAGVIEVEDMAEAYLDYGDRGAVFYATTAYATDSPVVIEVQCEKGSLRFYDDVLEIRRAGDVETRRYPCVDALGKTYWGAGHHLCIGDFYGALVKKAPFACGVESIVDTMDTMFALYASAKEGGRRVAL